MIFRSALFRWSLRSAFAAGWLLAGWGLMRSQHFVWEFRGAEVSQNIPLALPRPAKVDAADAAEWQSAAEGTPAAAPCLHGHLAVTPLVEEKLGAVSLWAVDRRDGQSLWKTALHRDLALAVGKGGVAPTPACDGQRIFLGVAVRGRLQLSAVDLRGSKLWTQDLGPVSGPDGRLFAPLLHESLAIVGGERGGSGWTRRACQMTAVHRLTGDRIWRVQLPDVETCGTPVLARLAGRPQILIPSAGRIVACDPSNGDELWTCRLDAGRPANSVAWNERFVVAALGSAVAAIRADGAGEFSAPQLVWQSAVTSAGTHAPVIYQSSVFCLGDNGHLTCLDLETGKSQWRKPLPGHYAQPPILIGDHLLCVNEQGAAFQVELGARGPIVHERPLATEISAPIAVIGRQLLIPRGTGLWSVPWERAERPVVNSPDRAPNRL